MNKVIILGRIGNDPELKVFDNGGQVCQFSVATDESYTNKQGERIKQTEWHNVVFSGKVAEVVHKYFKKGERILVEGKLRTRSWDSEQGKKYMTEIVGRTFSFIETRKDNQTHTEQPTYQTQNPFEGEEDDDLPF